MIRLEVGESGKAFTPESKEFAHDPTIPAPATKQQTAKITSKGQITIPTETRRLLGVKPGDKVIFESTQDGIKVTRQTDENVFEKYRGPGMAFPNSIGRLTKLFAICGNFEDMTKSMT